MTQHYTVLGGAGFVGQRLASVLTARCADVWVPARHEPEIFTRPLGVVFYSVGLTADYAKRPFDTVEAHVSYLARVMEQADFEHLVYLSSTRLYDGLDIEVGNGDTLLSMSPNNPRHLYDLSKAMGENLCRTAARERASIARLSCVYDPEPGSPGFLSELLQRARSETEFTLDSTPGYCRDYVSLDDTVASLIAMGEQRACDIFNVASGKNTFNQEIADTLRPHVDISFSRTGEPMHLAHCEVSKLRALGVSPKDTLQSIDSILRNPYS